MEMARNDMDHLVPHSFLITWDVGIAKCFAVISRMSSTGRSGFSISYLEKTEDTRMSGFLAMRGTLLRAMWNSIKPHARHECR